MINCDFYNRYDVWCNKKKKWEIEKVSWWKLDRGESSVNVLKAIYIAYITLVMHTCSKQSV